MQRLLRSIAVRWSAFLDRLLVRRRAGGVFFGPLLIASAAEAFAFKMSGLKQGRLAKDPWAPDPALGAAPPLADAVRTWPVHDGDVGAGFLRRLLETVLQLAWSTTSNEGNSSHEGH